MQSEHADIWARLRAPFGLEDLEWRVGATTKEKDKGMCLIYVTNRAIQYRLDDVIGPPNWQVDFRPWRPGETPIKPETWKPNEIRLAATVCRIALCIDGVWISKEDMADETDTEPAKGGASASMKRAAVQWGIGRYLYAMPDFWAPLEQGKYFPRDWRPPIPAAFLPSGSPPPASRPAPSPKPKAEPKRQPAKPQAAREPGPASPDTPALPKPEWWGEPTKEGMEFFDMTWADAWERNGYDFLGWCQSVVEEIRADIAKNGRKPTPKELRLRDAVAYMESLS